MDKRPKTVLYLLLALCFAATAQIELFDRGYEAAGAMRRDLFWAGDYWRALTSVFIHGGWLHLALNGIALYVLGRAIVGAFGGLVLALITLAAAEAGMAASLLTAGPHYDPTWRVGISGGVSGLVGLIFAIEWAMSRDWAGFLRRRNVRILGFFLVLNVALAIGIELFAPDILIDHAAHVGGLALGLVAGLVWFTRRGVHSGRGLAVALLLSLLPLGYAAYPYYNAEFFRQRAERMYAAEDRESAATAYRRVLALDPGDYLATARIAQITDDVELLDQLPRPASRQDATVLEDACLELATARIESDPDTAARLVARTRRSGVGNLAPWHALAALAEEAERPRIAGMAHAEIIHRAQVLNLRRTAWRSALKVLVVSGPGAFDDRERYVREAYEIAVTASLGLRDDSGASEAERRLLEQELARYLVDLAREAREIGDDPGLWARLAGLYRRLADNIENLASASELRLDAARWAERRLALIENPPPREIEIVEGLFRAAYAEGRESGQAMVVAYAGHWLRARGIEPPEPDPTGDLAPGADGG